MTKLLLIAVIILAGFILVVFVDIFCAFHVRKCPYCGKKMKFVYEKKDNQGNFQCWVFHCPHCGAYEDVTPEQLNEEKK